MRFRHGDRIRPGQVVVVTGASAGIGRAAAVAFAERGARVALVARGESDLEGAAAEIDRLGGQAKAFPVDMSEPHQAEDVARDVEASFGAIDVWVNDAFTSVLARFLDIEPEEFKRVTEVDYLGYVYGTRAALKRMTRRDRGTIVQVGSVLAYRGIPLQSAYCGAGHAIQGFNESLRCELLHDKSNVRVTMVQLPAMNTPRFDRAAAAGAVVYAAGHPRRREYWVGGSTAATLLANAVAPGLLDRYLARTGFRAQQADRTAHGSADERAKEHSPQLWASQHHGTLAAAGGVAAAATLAAIGRHR